MVREAVRRPAFAGSFYPADFDSLEQEIKTYIDNADPPVTPERVIGLISPHAGYPYSGPAAAYGFKLVQGKPYKRVVVFALSHRVDFRGGSIFPGTAYETPLGKVNLDTELVDRLRSNPVITSKPMAHQMEHSLEVQIPFLQYALDDFLLIPILIRDQSLSVCREIADAVLEALPDEANEDTLIVGSTDLYHGPDYRECQDKDEKLAELVKNFDEEALEQNFSSGSIMACGPASIMTTMLVSKGLGAQKADILHLTNSTDVTGQRTDYVVGYLSAVFH